MKFWQSRKFSQLEQKWYEKLKDDGFIDQERKIGQDTELIQKASNVYRQAPEVVRDAKIIYFDVLKEYILISTFKDEGDKLIMMLRSEGYKIKEISQKLKELGQKNHRQTIRYIIRSYEHKWNIRHWTQTQLRPQWKKRKTSIK